MGLITAHLLFLANYFAELLHYYGTRKEAQTLHTSRLATSHLRAEKCKLEKVAGEPLGGPIHCRVLRMNAHGDNNESSTTETSGS